MSDYSQIYIHLIFAVKGRESAISTVWEDKLYSYVTGVVKNKGQKLLAINGMPDHIHIALSILPSCCLSDLVREIKKSTNEFINTNYSKADTFKWQTGFAAFSFSKSNSDKVIAYIMKQKEHHRLKPFREEFIQFINSYEIENKQIYLSQWLNEIEGKE